MKAECRRCGECCRRGGPVLHVPDRGLFAAGVLSLADVVRIRKDEPAFDPLAARVTRAAADMLKLAGRGRSWSCRFFDPDPPACAIHARRPLECRLLFCRAPEDLAAVVGKDLLSLAAAGADPALCELARGFDRAFPFSVFNRLSAGARSDPAVLAELTGLLNRELAFRAAAAARHGLSPAMEAAVLGRPFFLTAAAAGFTVRERGGMLLLDHDPPPEPRT